MPDSSFRTALGQSATLARGHRHNLRGGGLSRLGRAYLLCLRARQRPCLWGHLCLCGYFSIVGKLGRDRWLEEDGRRQRLYETATKTQTTNTRPRATNANKPRHRRSPAERDDEACDDTSAASDNGRPLGSARQRLVPGVSKAANRASRKRRRRRVQLLSESRQVLADLVLPTLAVVLAPRGLWITTGD